MGHHRAAPIGYFFVIDKSLSNNQLISINCDDNSIKYDMHD